MARSDDVVEILIDNVSISDLAERLGLAVRRQSGAGRAVCPFHDDTSPSLALYERSSSEDRPHFHCYACGAHGDIFHLAQQKLGKTFPEAVDWLAGQYGVTVSKRTTRSSLSGAPGVPRGLRSNGIRRALEIYATDTAADEQLKGLSEARGFELQFLVEAGLTIALPGTLKKAALSSPASRGLLADLEASELIRAHYEAATEQSSYHLNLGLWREFFFDGRAIFPIRKESGELVALAGRALSSGQQRVPKYLYSPGFKKAENLFRIEIAFQSLYKVAKDQRRAKLTSPTIPLALYVVEGLFDALRLESLGYPAVAILGADLSASQADLIGSLSERLAADFGVPLHCHVFLDRDDAGVRGAAKALKMLLSRNVEADFIWIPNSQYKDPDEFLRGAPRDMDPSSAAQAPLLALLADALGTTPTEILCYQGWEHISPQRFRSASERIHRDLSRHGPQKSPRNVQGLTDILSRKCGQSPDDTTWWIRQFRELANFSKPSNHAAPGIYIEEVSARLNYARKLAWSSIQRGELPVDELAWRRIDSVAPLFNRGLLQRLKDPTDSPISVFDAIYVPRGFDQSDQRVKSISCPEDLILQQYVLAELLSERYGEAFRNSIPAVRYSRRECQTTTTGEIADSIDAETLSFAYQIDTDILEGWDTPKESGIFRHYWECWQDFIGTLRKRTSSMDGQIHSVRLDLKRYYDNIQRPWLRDVLLPSVQRAFRRGSVSEKLAASLMLDAQLDPDVMAARVVDWLLKQSFGYEYFEPSDGKVVLANPGHGLPQGPDLSAYLATIALFPIDREMRTVLDRINSEDGQVHAVYVRYVDDIILVADSEALLGQLRSRLEDALRGTGLQAVNKHGPVRPMSKSEFSASLTEGRAFTPSMPAPGFCLSPDGDGGAHFEGGLPESRSDALIVLNDPRLYFAPRQTVIAAISSALSVHGELRHNEVVKGARWLWYLLSEDEHADITSAKNEYFRLWNEAFGSADLWGGLDVPKRPWSDPAAYALEALDRLLSDKFLNWLSFTQTEKEIVGRRLRRLADLISREDSHSFFIAELEAQNSPSGWGLGLSPKLQRMFLQRMAAIRSKSFLLCGQTSIPNWAESTLAVSSDLSRSLRYAKIGVIESTGTDPILASDRTGTTSTWGDSFALLHEAIARLRATKDPSQDPVKGLGELIISNDQGHNLTRAIVDPLLLWFKDDPLADVHLEPEVDSDHLVNGSSYELALQSFVSAVPSKLLGTLLSYRIHLLREICNSQGEIVVLPMIAHAPASNGSPFLYFLCGASTLYALSLSKIRPTTRFFDKDWTAKQSSVQQIYCWTAELGPLTASQRTMASPQSIIATDVKRLGQMARKLIEDALTLDGPEDLGSTERPISAANIYERQGEYVDCEVISGPTSSAMLGTSAFIRDGAAGIRTVAVPLEDAWLWRIGVALSDYFGFVDDLDHFTPLPKDEVKAIPSDEPSPAWYFMREALFRLRGGLASRRSGAHRSDVLRFVPCGIFRLIYQLERFPAAADSHQAQLAFLLSTLTETEAMRLRLGETSVFGEPGVAIDFVHRLSFNIVRYKLKAQWGSWLPMATRTKEVRRRPIAAIHALISRFDELPLCDAKDQSADQFFHAGLDIVATSLTLRLTVLELSALLDITGQLKDVRHGWTCIGYFSTASTTIKRNLLDEFRTCISAEGKHAGLDRIAPLGWATLLSAIVDVIPSQMNSEWARNHGAKYSELLTLVTELVERFSIQCAGVDDEAQWPFDHGLSDWVEDIAQARSASLAIEILTKIDLILGLRIVEREDSAFTYRENQFDGEHHLPVWRLFNWWPERHRESKREGERYLYPWTETWAGDRLLSVATIGASFARLASLSSATEIEVQARLVQAPTVSRLAPEGNLTPGLIEETRESINIPSHGEPTTWTTDSSLSLRQSSLVQFQKFQFRAWQERGAASQPNSHHVRVALLQWQIDDTYRHPLVDTGVPDAIAKIIDPANDGRVLKQPRRGEEHKYDTRTDGILVAAFKPSWAEHRRQAIIRSALTACAKFGVEVLVLPEYSVRPETVLAIRQMLVDIDGAPAVYAGTYRMFGSSEPGRRLSELGLVESKHLDRQAVLSLMERKAGDTGVDIWTRAKRYPSAAANEFFSPSSVRSLFLERANRSPGFDGLSVFIELVCSELFIATSPSNVYFLAHEYQKLTARFGQRRTTEEILDQVQIDVREYANRTSFGRPREFWPRKSILVVPAMTSRSADYWIFGQSAMLSSSMTTVFCNAVSGKHGVGGSCFIGRASWHHGDFGSCMLPPTPYHGWSHGILYSGKDDPLSEKEQALLIADIDPVHMAEGKPRPQSLSNPLQLVAYLPIIESLENSTKDLPFANRAELSEILETIARKIAIAGVPTSSQLHHTQTGLANELDKLADMCADGKSLRSRTEAWRNDSNEQPYFGSAPPALVDWIPVDLTPRTSEAGPELPKLLVPPWSS